MSRRSLRALRAVAVAVVAVFAAQAWSETLEVPDDYASIQAAVNVAMPGDTIMVSSGTYTESVTIAKKLKIKGDDQPTLEGNFTVLADDVTIEGFRVMGSIFLDFDSATVRKNTVFAETDDDIGIFVRGNYNEVEENVLFLGNWGIRITGNYNKIESNEVGNPYRHSIYVEGRYNHVEDNDVFGAILGILVQGERHTIQDNRAFRNESGIRVEGVGHYVAGNDSEGNFEDGFDVAGRDSVFDDLNQAEDNGVFGFRILPGATGNTLRNNEGDSNRIAGFFIAGTENVFEENEAENNGDYGFHESELAASNSYDDNDCEDNGIAPSNVPGLCD
jgi:parallel beta-helix repeat protein